MRMLGQFEHAVLGVVQRQHGKGYGMSIRRDVSEMLGRDISIGALYTALSRLERKGFVSSRWGEATPERGGRAKRYFQIEAPGQRALQEAEAVIRRTAGLVPSEA